MAKIIVKTPAEELLRAKKWWHGLEAQWKIAFNEAVFGIGPVLQPPKDEALILLLTRADTLRFAGPLAAKPNMTTKVNNLSGLEWLKHLRFISLSHCDVVSLMPLAQHYQLAHLFVYNNKIKTLDGVENLLNLEEFYFNVNEITSLKPLQRLTQLRTIYANYNKLTSLEGITEAHSNKLRNFYVEPNDDLPHREIIRLQNECGIICRRG